jgi:hypothetical protein
MKNREKGRDKALQERKNTRENGLEKLVLDKIVGDIQIETARFL